MIAKRFFLILAVTVLSLVLLQESGFKDLLYVVMAIGAMAGFVLSNMISWEVNSPHLKVFLKIQFSLSIVLLAIISLCFYNAVEAFS